MIINLPKDLAKETTHRYGPNSFKLHRCVLLLVSCGDEDRGPQGSAAAAMSMLMRLGHSNCVCVGARHGAMCRQDKRCSAWLAKHACSWC